MKLLKISNTFFIQVVAYFPAGNYMFKVNNRSRQMRALSVTLDIQKRRPELFWEKGVLKISQIYRKKLQCRSLFLIKLQDYSLEFYQKRYSDIGIEFCEIFKSTYFEKHRRVAGSERFKFQKFPRIELKNCMNY